MAVVINHSDPGAVPGASTKARQGMIPRSGYQFSDKITPNRDSGLRRGRNSIDEGVKGSLFLGMVPPLSGYAIVANDNYAPVAQAA
jgi:hypothetical protein